MEIDLKGIEWQNAEWIQLAWDMEEWRILVIIVIISTKCAKFLDELNICEFLKTISVPCNWQAI